MNFLIVFGPVLAAAVLGGLSAGLLGVLVVGLRIPFLAVCTAHAAMAGAILGRLCGLPVFGSGFGAACLGAAVLGWLLRRRDLEANTALGTLFSLMLGLAFLGLALTPGPKAELFGLLWGSPVFATWGQALVMGVVTLLEVLFVWRLGKELKLLLFSRELAAALIPEALVLGLLLVLAAAVITVNLEVVGGLLVYSLIANPGVAALRLARSFRAALVWSAVLGVFSAAAGLLAAYLFDVPAGCCIVLASSLPVFLALARPRKAHGPAQPREGPSVEPA